MNADQSTLTKMVVSRYVMAFVAIAAIIFLPAWSLRYWQGWLYMAILFIPMLFVMVYMLRNAPDLLERRLRMRERETQQKKIIALSYIPFFAAYILPGFDVRLGWSNVPAWVSIAAALVVLAGYAIVFLVFRENQYASRVVEVEKEQSVISSGPYGVVRHPMYVGMILLYVFSPLVLGSYWAMIPALFILPVIVARILNEEKVLARDLNGYPEYMRNVRYRLVPGVW